MTKDEYNEFRNQLEKFEDVVYGASEQYKTLRKEASLPCGDGYTWDGFIEEFGETP